MKKISLTIIIVYSITLWLETEPEITIHLSSRNFDNFFIQ